MQEQGGITGWWPARMTLVSSPPQPMCIFKTGKEEDTAKELKGFVSPTGTFCGKRRAEDRCLTTGRKRDRAIQLTQRRNDFFFTTYPSGKGYDLKGKNSCSSVFN